MAANLSTSRMIDDLAARYANSKVLRTAVGEANVAEAMQSENALVGGEGNGGVIWPKVCWVRDSASSMALILSLLAEEKKPLSAIIDELPRYAMIKQKMDLSAIGGRDAVGDILKKVSDSFSGEKVNNLDGVRIDFADGWVHLRPSNTEPIIRLIAEGGTQRRAEELVAMVAEAAGL